jgi:hypothetical protein
MYNNCACQIHRFDDGGVDEFNFFGPVRALLAALPLIPRSGW